MKAQAKALVASLIIVALGLSAVSGVTYSWWSDSDSADVIITAGSMSLDLELGTPIVDCGSAEIVRGSTADPIIYTINATLAGNDNITIPITKAEITADIGTRYVESYSISSTSAGTSDKITVTLSQLSGTVCNAAQTDDGYDLVDTTTDPKVVIESNNLPEGAGVTVTLTFALYQSNAPDVPSGSMGSSVENMSVSSGQDYNIIVDHSESSPTDTTTISFRGTESNAGIYTIETISSADILNTYSIENNGEWLGGVEVTKAGVESGTLDGTEVTVTFVVDRVLTCKPTIYHAGTVFINGEDNTKWVESEDALTSGIGFTSVSSEGKTTIKFITTQGFSPYCISDNGVVLVGNADQLLTVMNNVKENGKKYNGKTIRLTADIDLDGCVWTPLGKSDDPFYGTFDGNGHTIYNLNVTGPSDDSDYGPSGFVGWLGQSGVPAYVKDLTIDGATILGNHYTGAIAGYLNTGSIENCIVKNTTLVNTYRNEDASGDKTGGIVDQTNTEGGCSIKGCVVEDIDITGVRDIGCIAGASNNADKITGCLVRGDNWIVVDQTGSQETKDPNAGPILGRNLVIGVPVSPTNDVEDNSISISAKVCTSAQFNKVLAAGISDISVQGDDVFKFDTTGSAPSGVAKNIKITLLTDVVFEADSATQWTNAFGWSDTDSIIIDGKGLYNLTFYHPDSDANHVTTNGAELILKDLRLSNSKYNDGPWNRHDIVFDCRVSLKNVRSDKAIALGGDATFDHVTIKDSDVYGLWIEANGQTVDLKNVTIEMGTTDGRAIAIKDQYVKDPQKVTLTITDSVIKSQTKAAVLVTSAAGATINAQNVDISSVSADNQNLVWIDNGEGYKNLTDTEVAGGTAIIEP